MKTARETGEMLGIATAKGPRSSPESFPGPQSNECGMASSLGASTVTNLSDIKSPVGCAVNSVSPDRRDAVVEGW